jgi:hypothetical protein
MITAPVRATGKVLFGLARQCPDDLLRVRAVESASQRLPKAPVAQPYLHPEQKY